MFYLYNGAPFILLFIGLLIAAIVIHRRRQKVVPKETEMDLNKSHVQSKRSYGFLWWGGFLAVGFFFMAFRTIEPIIFIFAGFPGLLLTLGICFLWHFLSHRKQMRGWLPKMFGEALAAIGSVVPMVISLDVLLPDRPLNESDINLLLIGLVITAMCLVSAFFLCFRSSKKPIKST